MSATLSAALPDAPARPQRRPFRYDIEGLRAVTALLVAGFHIWGNKVSGGVDVFFVISGYFITFTLLGHLAEHGRVRAGAYFARLAQRLFPGSVVVIAVTLVLVWVVLLPTARTTSSIDAVAAQTFTENVRMAIQSVDYLAKDQPKSPFQQFWALSIQGQFYALWCLLVVMAATIAARTSATARTVLAVVVIAVSIISVTWSIVQTAGDQSVAYFSPLTRIWEFGLGSLAALFAGRIAVRRGVGIAMVWLGLAGIIACAAFLPVESQFPGYAALWPTACAALILLSGDKGPKPVANAFLNLRILVRMGGFAFAIYLWHWPLLMVARSLGGTTTLGPTAGLVVILLAIVLAWASTRWVESPLRRTARSGTAPERRRANLTIAAMSAIVLLLSTASYVTSRGIEAADRAASASVNTDGSPCFGALSAVAATQPCIDPGLGDRLFPAGNVSEDLQRPQEECAVNRAAAVRARSCSYAAVGAERRIGLIGNSHAIAWFPALEKVAADRGLELRVWYKTGCQFTTPQRAHAENAPQCEAWVQNVIEDIRKDNRYDFVVTSQNGDSFWGESVQHPDREAGRRAIDAAWSPLIDAGITMVGLRDFPYSSDERMACVERAGLAGERECALDRSALSERDVMHDFASHRRGAVAIDLTNAFCDERQCWTVRGNVKVFRDRSHLSDTYARTLAGALDAKMTAAGLVEPPRSTKEN